MVTEKTTSNGLTVEEETEIVLSAKNDGTEGSFSDVASLMRALRK